MLDKRQLQSYLTMMTAFVRFSTLKNIIAVFYRFVLYVRNNTEFGHTKQMNVLDIALIEHLKIANRGVTNERNLKTFERRQGVGEVSLKECMLQLNALLPKMKSIMKMDKEMMTIEHARYFIRVLQAILQIRHAQRSGVGTGLTVGEWNARSTVQEHTVLFVLDHKTSAGGSAEICLDKEEYKQFEFYMRKICPMFSKDLSPNASFFVNNKGGRLDQTSKDLGRLVMTVNNNKVRKAYQMAAAGLDLAPTHMNSINLFLHLSEHTASAYYRNRELIQVVGSRDLLRSLLKGEKPTAPIAPNSTTKPSSSKGKYRKRPHMRQPASPQPGSSYPQPGPSHRPDFSPTPSGSSSPTHTPLASPSSPPAKQASTGASIAPRSAVPPHLGSSPESPRSSSPISYAKHDIARAKENLLRDFPITLEGKMFHTHVSFELKYTKKEEARHQSLDGAAEEIEVSAHHLTFPDCLSNRATGCRHLQEEVERHQTRDRREMVALQTPGVIVPSPIHIWQKECRNPLIFLAQHRNLKKCLFCE